MYAIMKNAGKNLRNSNPAKARQAARANERDKRGIWHWQV